MFETKELGKTEVETCELDQVADDNHVEYIEEEMMKVENNISGDHIKGGRLRCIICNIENTKNVQKESFQMKVSFLNTPLNQKKQLPGII